VAVREIGPGETGLAFAAMRELRPHLADAEGFAAHVDAEQRPEGYRLVGAFEDGPEAVAVAGFRVLTSLHAGRYVYVDDLSTVPAARGRGHARALLDHVAAEGRAQGCVALHLDSGVGPERADAHRLYLNAGMRITSHHFARALPGPASR
jgi:GNAT superfamily N-acetyltransferase